MISLKAETVGLDSDFIRHNPRETSVLYHTPGKAEITVFAFVYNTPEEMLRRAVESVLSQTYTNFEFVVVDNACTDDSPRVLAEYAAKDSRVRVITFPENTNFSYNDTYINERYEYLKTLFNGEYICNIDSDDYYDQDFLEEMYCLAKEHTADMVICGSYWKPENDRESVQSYGYPYAVCADDEAIAVFLRENTPAFSTVWGRLTKAAIFKECFRHVPEVGSGLDTYVGILSAGRCGVIVSSGKILYHHLLRKSSYANVIERRHKVISRNLPIRDALAEFFRLKNAVSDLTADFTDSITRGGVASYDMAMLENAKDSSPLVVFEALEYLFSSELLWRVFGGYEKGLEYFEKALGLARHIQANNNELPEIKNGFLYHIAKVFNDTKDFERVGRNEVKTFINAVFDLRNPNRFGRYYLERLFRGYDAPFWGCLSHVQDRYYQDKREFVNAILQKDSVMVLENLLAAMFESGGDSLSREVVRRIGGHEGIKQLDEDFIRHFRHETSLIYHGAYKQAYRCLENKLKHASENNGLEQILTALLRAAALCEKVEWFIDVRLKRLKFYMSAGRVDDAVDEYLALEDVCGDKKLLCKLKAELYVLCGDPGNAAATVAEALAAFPGDVEFAEALQTLGLGVTAHMRT
ncbi:MAG: glycosyltransferase [Clostridiales bacterium]|nr:glycosyltransferase [Clostridiales bacterium]